MKRDIGKHSVLAWGSYKGPQFFIKVLSFYECDPQKSVDHICTAKLFREYISLDMLHTALQLTKSVPVELNAQKTKWSYKAHLEATKYNGMSSETMLLRNYYCNQ